MSVTFKPLNVSSKFAICGLPLRVDSYKTCSFNCAYCFANHRAIMGFEKNIKIGDVNWLKTKLSKIYDKKEVNPNNFLDLLLKNRVTWHWGGMSDPFQPIEEKLNITAKLVEVSNQYDISCLFSTKTDSYYTAKLNPKQHSFQLSVTNLCNHKIEPNVAPVENRIAFFKKLKNEGFKVGIRIQPFIPKLSTPEIVETFKEADYFSIEGLKLVPQNKEQKDNLLHEFKLSQSDFVQMGLLNLKTSIRIKLYEKTIAKLESYGIPYSIADNDLHQFSKSKCCCGEPLVHKSSDFSNTALLFKKRNYTLSDVKDALGEYASCKANHLFSSNRQEGCCTVWDYYQTRFKRDSSPFSKKFLSGKVADKNQKTLVCFNSEKK